ncbi:MAG: hypothetical protein GY861_14845 [bacterium]|nr:hypothetical protein [bacterium]
MTPANVFPEDFAVKLGRHIASSVHLDSDETIDRFLNSLPVLTKNLSDKHDESQVMRYNQQSRSYVSDIIYGMADEFIASNNPIAAERAYQKLNLDIADTKHIKAISDAHSAQE